MKLRTLTTTLAAGALLGAGAATPAQAQTATYPTDGASSSTKGKGKKTRGKVLSQAQLETVAEELGVTVDQVTAAFKAVRAAVRATEERETRAEIDALLAKELGVTTQALADALAAAAPARGERPARADGDRGGRGGGCGGRGDGDAGGYPSDGSGGYPSDGSGSGTGSGSGDYQADNT